jgi:hypothetical protein
MSSIIKVMVIQMLINRDSMVLKPNSKDNETPKINSTKYGNNIVIYSTLSP